MNENVARMVPQDPVTSLPGIGVKRAETLLKLQIRNIDDLLRHYPRRYEDRRRPEPVLSLKNGVAALVRVYVRRVINAPAGMRRIPMKVICGDDSGEVTLLFFNTRWLSRAFAEGQEYWVYGTPRIGLAGFFMAHPDFEAVTQAGAEGNVQDAGAGIIPIYPLTAGLTQKYLRAAIRAAMPATENMTEFLPDSLLMKRRLAPLAYALKQIHFPEDEHALNAARYRLVYEEWFLLQAKLLFTRFHSRAVSVDKAPRIREEDFCVDDASRLFPYRLTGAQRRVIEEIRMDMTAAAPMHRLLQGDVGSGKTAVAAAAAMFAAGARFQTAVMAPTEILAAQHFMEFERLFHETGVRTALLTSSLSAAQRRDVLEGLKTGEISIVTGTHALIEPGVVFSRLGLVITDEQHRFGVRQRLLLREKGIDPDTLVMTATPIPRTLALMLYADLDVSVLDEMPPGRKPVETRFINSMKRDAAYEFAEREMAAGRQVYVVAPMIDDEETDDPVQDQDALKSAVRLSDELSARFPLRRVGVLHGRMKGDKKDVTMRAFAAGEIDLLVCTVVIEVGVNVPNATMMIVENSERFGLAQLHQLRGRVGRGAEKSYCVLISDSKSELSVKRGETLSLEHDGFRIAELDLTLRGPGDIFGVRQHGLPELKIADPAKHMDILRKASEDAKELFLRDQGLEAPEHAILRSMVYEAISCDE